MRTSSLTPLVAVVALLLMALSATAATVTRSYPLRAGWNAVYLDVRPPDPTAEVVLDGLPLENAWRHQTRMTTVDFIQDPTEAVWNRDQWLLHVPTNRVEALDNNLFQIQGGFCYLLKLSAPATWSVTGVPVVRQPRWKADAFNLRGFPIDGSAPPTFREFFKFSPAHYRASSATLQPIYTLGTDGRWTRVAPTDLMQEGAAYWVYTDGPTEFVAPFEVRVPGGDRLDFGASLIEQDLTLVNAAGGPVSLTLAETGGPSPTALALGTRDAAQTLQWNPFPALQIEPLAAQESRALRVAVQRLAMATASYESLLDVRDNLGTRFLIPVHAERTEGGGGGPALAAAGSGGSRRLAGAPTVSPVAGLWVGTISVSAVSEVHSGPLVTNRVGSDLTGASGSGEALEILRQPGNPTPTPVRNSFDLRVLIHVNAAGEPVLLKDVIQLWKDGTYETNAAGQKVVKTPGEYVLLTDSTRLAEFKGAGLRDTSAVGRRISTASFDFLSTPTNNFLRLTGELGVGRSLRGDYTILPDQPTNPFKHKFHPDHDNLDPTFKNRVEEAFEVSRAFELEFLGADPTPGIPASPDYGRTQIAGHYRETVSGLHQSTLHAEGTFRLRRISPIAALNPPSTP